MAGAQTKGILAVGVGPDQDRMRVSTRQQLAGLRLIIQNLVSALASNHRCELNRDYVVDYLQGMPGETLQQRIASALESSVPDMIFTITTRAAIAAKNARRAAGMPDLPLVFTVVSHPESPDYGSLVRPGDRKGDQITGVSTSLVPNVHKFRQILERFRDAAGRPLEAHSISHPDYVSSKRARQALTDIVWHDLPRNDEQDIIASIRRLMKVTDAGRRTCLLVTPSDIMYAFRHTVIRVAQGEMGIPTFFQQPECVRPETTDRRESAVAAYGLSPEVIGGEAAKLVAEVLRDSSAASRIPVVSPDNFEFRVNTAVAEQLELTPPSPPPAGAGRGRKARAPGPRVKAKKPVRQERAMRRTKKKARV